MANETFFSNEISTVCPLTEQPVPGNYFVRAEVTLIAVLLIFKLSGAKSTAMIVLVRLFSSAYLLYAVSQRMALRSSALTIDENKQESYLVHCMVTWIASVVFEVYKVRPFREKRQADIRNPNFFCTLATVSFVVNALGLLAYSSVVEYLFFVRLNSDASLRAFFVSSVVMKAIRILVQGYCFRCSTQPGDYSELVDIGWDKTSWTGLSNIIVLVENSFSVFMFPPQNAVLSTSAVVALILDIIYRFWLFLWFCNLQCCGIQPHFETQQTCDTNTTCNDSTESDTSNVVCDSSSTLDLPANVSETVNIEQPCVQEAGPTLSQGSTGIKPHFETQQTCDTNATCNDSTESDTSNVVCDSSSTLDLPANVSETVNIEQPCVQEAGPTLSQGSTGIKPHFETQQTCDTNATCNDSTESDTSNVFCDSSSTLDLPANVSETVNTLDLPANVSETVNTDNKQPCVQEAGPTLSQECTGNELVCNCLKLYHAPPYLLEHERFEDCPVMQNDSPKPFLSPYP